MLRCRSAFTLIELLVVIAIIAILAAILFPVFAQAKDAAKDTAALSNFKQTGLSHLMYSSDNDDSFVLAASLNSGDGWNTWQYLVQPYTKNFGVMLHPKVPVPSGPNAYWLQLLHMGVHPRAAAVKGPETAFTWTSGQFTGGQTVLHDGLFGHGIEDPEGDPWYEGANAPSLTATQVERPSDVAMVMDAASWDMFLGGLPKTDALEYCMTWTGLNAYPWGDGYMSTGPIPRKRVKGAMGGCIYMDGTVQYVATDGSAKSADLRGKFWGRKQRADGTWVMPLMWPGSVD
jgi:prepilin-type N-terminal cleavage/methylation domain-containing protein